MEVMAWPRSVKTFANCFVAFSSTRSQISSVNLNLSCSKTTHFREADPSFSKANKKVRIYSDNSRILTSIIENEKIFSELHSLYLRIMKNKKIFVDKYPSQLEDLFVVNVQSFSREMLLDPSECENAFFILP